MFLARAFPLLSALQGYTRADLRADAIAGATTAVMLVPQGMAYAMLAGLPPIFGVYAALVPGVLYALLGTSRQLSVGPVAMDSLLVAAGVGAIADAGSEAYLSAVVLLALMVGVLQVAMGILRMGFLVNFLSVPVMSGFTSAAAIIIGLSQVRHLLGVQMSSAPQVTTLVQELATNLGGVSWETATVGGGAVLLILALKRWAKKVPAALVSVTLGAGIVAVLGWSERVSLVGEVPAGLPAFVSPVWNAEVVRALLPTAVMIALVAFMESISVGKVYARKNGYEVDPDRELIALGCANAAGSFLRGYPVAGGFSRTAVNAEAGARTPLAALITSALVGLSLLFLTPFFALLPKAALAAIIVTSVVGLVDWREVIHLSRVKRADMTLLAITFAATLALGILPGIGLGVGASLVWLIWNTTRPHVAVLGRVPGTKLFRNVQRNRGLITYHGVLVVRMDAQFYFGNVSFLRRTLSQLEEEMQEPLRAVVLDFSAINGLDASAESALSEMLRQYRARGVELYLAAVKGPVRDVLEASGLGDELGGGGRCLTVHEALTLIDPEVRDASGALRSSVVPPSAGVRASGMSARL